MHFLNGNVEFSVYGILLAVGGFLIGFGSRYADGCTSGHTIMGLSLLSSASLLASFGFFIGGVLGSFLILDFLL
ncbi:MAG: YeeE/YedE family protein [Bacteroidia bacterium]|nr:YeeE/YedE family protein [Bacteroidia bacterium]